jgi:hypothetical protein
LQNLWDFVRGLLYQKGSVILVCRVGHTLAIGHFECQCTVPPAYEYEYSYLTNGLMKFLCFSFIKPTYAHAVYITINFFVYLYTFWQNSAIFWEYTPIFKTH